MCCSHVTVGKWTRAFLHTALSPDRRYVARAEIGRLGVGGGGGGGGGVGGEERGALSNAVLPQPVILHSDRR